MVHVKIQKKKDDSIKRIGIMHLLGITFILYLLKLSAGNGFWKNKVCFSTILYNRISRRCTMCLGVGLLQSKIIWNFQETYVVYLSYFTLC